MNAVLFNQSVIIFFLWQAKRLKKQELFAKEGLTWQKIVHFCSEHQDKAKQQAASQELKSLFQAAKQIGN